jgi:hypothetical protein
MSTKEESTYEDGLREGRTQTLENVKEMIKKLKLSILYSERFLNNCSIGKFRECVIKEIDKKLLSKLEDDNSQKSKVIQVRKQKANSDLITSDNIPREKGLCKNCGHKEESHSKLKHNHHKTGKRGRCHIKDCKCKKYIPQEETLLCKNCGVSKGCHPVTFIDKKGNITKKCKKYENSEVEQ